LVSFDFWVISYQWFSVTSFDLIHEVAKTATGIAIQLNLGMSESGLGIHFIGFVTEFDFGVHEYGV
jgi:hypothetical protein